MKFFKLFLLILSSFSFPALSSSNGILDFQCYVDIIRKNGEHIISVANIISNEYLITSAEILNVKTLKTLIITCCDQNSFLIKPKRHNIIINKGHKDDSGANNLALIRVPKSRLKADCIRPIDLPCLSGDSYLPHKESVSTTFSGSQKSDSKDLPTISMISVAIKDVKSCSELYNKIAKYKIDNTTNMCIEPKTNLQKCSVNQPVLVKNINNEYTLVGITIKTMKDCNTGPIAAIKLSKFYDWIEKMTKNNVPKCTRIDCNDLFLETIGSECNFNDAMFYFLTNG